MRSKSSDKEGSAPEQFPRPGKDHSFQGPEDKKQRQQDKDPTRESDAILPYPKSHSGNGHQGEDLSRDDLLFLLSILEGELQARDEVIGVLKAEKMDLALLEAQYGFVTPKKVLEALQRDAFQAKSAPWQEDIYEKPMNEFNDSEDLAPRTKCAQQGQWRRRTVSTRPPLHKHTALLALLLADISETPLHP